MIVHQFLPTFEPGAVGAHAVLARRLLRDAGHTSEIFAAEVRGAAAEEAPLMLDDYRGGADVIVYQMAIGSVTGDFVLARREPLVVNYHNLTPVRYFMGWERVATQGIAWGMSQLRALGTRASLGLAVSHYNEHDLLEAGFSRTAVVPFLLDLQTLDIEADPSVPHTDSTTWLFVGRLAPNKAQHDLVKAFAAYRRFHDANARLVLVGGGVDGAYARTLTLFVHALGLDDAVTITGPVSRAALAGWYRAADVLVVVSEHEGFCVPLVEAMHHRVPIVAHAAAAIPETVDGAGLLLDTKDPCTVAAAVDRVVHDDALRRHLVDAGAARAPRFDVTGTGALFVDAVTSVAR